MKRMLLILLAAVLLAPAGWAADPRLNSDQRWETPVDSSAAPQNDRTEAMADVGILRDSSEFGHYGSSYTAAEINEIANVVNGEVGGIGGASVVLTFADGSQLLTDGYALRRIHACVVDNQVKSGLFPATVDGCVRQCWSTAYASTGWRESRQWQSCREAVVEALCDMADVGIGHYGVPDNVYAATCDGVFSSYYPGWHLWARVDWDTGWYSGTFYYYQYG